MPDIARAARARLSSMSARTGFEHGGQAASVCHPLHLGSRQSGLKPDGQSFQPFQILRGLRNSKGSRIQHAVPELDLLLHEEFFPISDNPHAAGEPVATGLEQKIWLVRHCLQTHCYFHPSENIFFESNLHCL